MLLIRFGMIFGTFGKNNHFNKNHNEVYLKKKYLNGVEEYKKD